MQTIVAECARHILFRLDPPPMAPEYLIAGRLGSAANPSPVSHHQPIVVLDVTAAERLEGGTMMLAAASHATVSAWQIFVRARAQPDAAFIAFVERGTISVSLEPLAFVTAAYRCVLDRSVDPDGAATYSGRIRSGRLSQSDVLRILAASEEARDRHERLLIVAAHGPAGGDAPSSVLVWAQG